MLRDAEESRDVSQDAVLRLLQHRDEVPLEAAKVWLLRAVHHLCVDRLRRRAVRSGPNMEEVAPVLPDPSPGLDRSALSREAGQRIAGALASLPERDRAIVLVREVQGMPYDVPSGVSAWKRPIRVAPSISWTSLGNALADPRNSKAFAEVGCTVAVLMRAGGRRYPMERIGFSAI